MLIFLKYNLRAINYDLSQLKKVPSGMKLPNARVGDGTLERDTHVDEEPEESISDTSDMESLALSSDDEESSLSSDDEEFED